jgi:uncharacterized protein YbaR (Trm112 family)
MLWNRTDYKKCEKCGEDVDIMKPCRHCELKAKLEGLICPCCKGTNIHLSQQRDSNGIMGPGFSSWVTSENFVCLTCGVMFLDVRKK